MFNLEINLNFIQLKGLKYKVSLNMEDRVETSEKKQDDSGKIRNMFTIMDTFIDIIGFGIDIHHSQYGEMSGT